MPPQVPSRRRDVEVVVFGDGGGFVRMYELRLNPLVRPSPRVLCLQYVNRQRILYALPCARPSSTLGVAFTLWIQICL